MTISINEIQTGKALLINNDVYLVVELNHVKPGKGSAFVRVKMRNIRTDLNLERTFKTAEKLEEADLEERKLQYLYRQGDHFYFMDQKSYEEQIIDEKTMGENTIKFLQENLEVIALIHNNQVLKVYLPNFIVAQIVSSEPGIKGDSSRSGNKPATIDTGAMVQVPLFINQGEWVKIDTRDGQYVERVQK